MSDNDKKEPGVKSSGESFSAARSRDLTLRAMFRVLGVIVALMLASIFLDWAGSMCVKEQLNSEQTFMSKAICLPIVAITGAQLLPQPMNDDDEAWLERPEPTSLTVRRRSKQSFNLTPWTMKIVRGVLLISAFGCCAYVIWIWIRAKPSEEEAASGDAGG